MRVTAFLAMASMLAASAVLATPAPASPTSRVPPSADPRQPETGVTSLAPRARIVEPARHALATSSAADRVVVAEWARDLPAIDVSNKNTNARASLRLYADDGTIDETARDAFMRVASHLPKDDVSSAVDRLDGRLVQLVFRAAYHFKGAPITIISGTRKGARGRHGNGEALDFALDGISAAALAAHLRETPRAGVGIYVHPKTQYVHLDVRDQSFHWIDASPPGVTWREQLLPDPRQAARDASYAASMDLP